MKTLESLQMSARTWLRYTGDRYHHRRELTKMHEEVVRDTGRSSQYFTDHPDHVRGEFVVIVEI